MSWSEILLDGEFTVAFAPQADINTAGSVWTWIDCEMPQVSFDAAQTDTKRSLRSRGAATKNLTGRVWPRVSVRFPLVGQLATYAYASDTPGLKGANGLLNFLGGTAAMAYQAAGLSPTDGNTVSCLTTTGKYGCLIAGREASGAVNAMGFAKNINGVGPFTTDLFEDLKAQPGSSINRLATYTFFPSSTQPSPLTLRITGEHASQEKRYLGCMLSKATITFDADWRPYCTAEYIAYGGEVRGTSGGLFAGSGSVEECLAIEPLVERGGARFVVGSNVFATLADGTVDADGTCDIRDIEITWDIPHYVATKPPGTQGVKEVLMRSPTISAAFTLPDISDFEVSGAHFAEEAWRNLTEVSFSMYLGDTPGRLFAANLPRLLINQFPEVVMVDGARHRRIQGKCGHYSGDTASTDAGNKVARFAVG